MFSKLLITLATVFAVFVFTSCKKTGQARVDEPSRYPIPITATTGMIADVVREVGGNDVEVTGLIGEGTDPHLYKPTRNDLVSLSKADLVFYNGLKLEGKMEDTLRKMAERKQVIAVTEALANQEGYLQGDQAHLDPHVWMDVAGWINVTETIREALCNFDPKNADNYRLRADQYLEKLAALDSYAKESLASIPLNQRVLVTAHDAFGYLGRAYGIEVKGIQGISTESEAGVKDIENLVNFLVQKQIPSVFVETSVSDQNVKALLEGAKAKGHEVSIGGKLFSDAMGATGTYRGTYIGMIDHNVTTITRALGGQAPEGGLNQKLSN